MDSLSLADWNHLITHALRIAFAVWLFSPLSYGDFAAVKQRLLAIAPIALLVGLLAVSETAGSLTARNVFRPILRTDVVYRHLQGWLPYADVFVDDVLPTSVALGGMGVMAGFICTRDIVWTLRAAFIGVCAYNGLVIASIFYFQYLGWT